MLNRYGCACLLLAGMFWTPAQASAAVACSMGEDDDQCAEYVWGYNENGERVTGTRVGAEGEASETRGSDVGLSGSIDVGGASGEASAGLDGDRRRTFPYAAYDLSDGTRVELSCVDYTEIKDL